MINALIIVAFRDRAAITLCSIPAIVFAFCSTVYASVAISLREQCNLFFYNLYFIAKLFNRSYTETEEYKKDFARFAFVYCATIPIYITFSLFANNISSQNEDLQNNLKRNHAFATNLISSTIL